MVKLENESLSMENGIFRRKLQQLGLNPTSVLASGAGGGAGSGGSTAAASASTQDDLPAQPRSGHL